MGRCEDCKHWDKYDGECLSIDYCRSSTPPSVVGHDAIIYYAANDDQGLECGLVVGPKFGCVNFKGKEG